MEGAPAGRDVLGDLRWRRRLYLFGMDFLYDLEHGIFGKGGGGAVEAVIVALTLVFSLTALRYGWRTTGQLDVSRG